MARKQHQMHIPLDVIQTPKSGECLVGNFWMVHPERGALYVFDQGSAYSTDNLRGVWNRDERIVQRFLQKDHVVMQIPVAYLSHVNVRAEAFFKEVKATIEAARVAAPQSPQATASAT
ncbi:hypothetical protein O9X98_05965 [Agrobacterium salinitolerans]|nr:hypothetical protein [Agrobacterium salinitolerans]